MLTIHPEFVVDKEQRTRAVLLPMGDWEKVIEELEELDDIREYDRAKSASQESVPFDQAVHEIQEGYDA